MPSVESQGKRAARASAIEMDDVGAEAGLEGVVAPKRLGAGLRRQEQIAALDQPDVGALAVDGEELARAAEKVDAVEREADIDRRRELLADAAGRERGRRTREGRVLLDEEDAAGEGRIGREVIGRRGAVGGAANDGDVAVGVHATATSGRSIAVRSANFDSIRATPGRWPRTLAWSCSKSLRSRATIWTR